MLAENTTLVLRVVAALQAKPLATVALQTALLVLK